MTIKILRATVFQGKPLSCGGEYDIPSKDARFLVKMGKAKEIEPKREIKIKSRKKS